MLTSSPATPTGRILEHSNFSLSVRMVCRLFTSCMNSLHTYIHFEGKLQDSSLLNITLRTRSKTSSPATPQGTTPTGRSLEQSNFSLSGRMDCRLFTSCMYYSLHTYISFRRKAARFVAAEYCATNPIENEFACYSYWKKTRT